ncbi:hypothetical protein ACVWYK_004553 [Bradyrhizobium sp. USDA 4470]
MVQVAHPARLRRRLATRLARDVGLLHRGRAGPEDIGSGDLSLGPAASALPLPRPSVERRGASAGQGLRGTGHPMDRDAARDAVGAPGSGPSLRLSRLLRHRLFDQRQAERAGHMDSARDRRGRGNPRSRDGRSRRGRAVGARVRGSLSSGRRMALSACPQRRGRWLCHRNAPASLEFRDVPLSGRPRQQLGAWSERT